MVSTAPLTLSHYHPSQKSTSKFKIKDLIMGIMGSLKEMLTNLLTPSFYLTLKVCCSSSVKLCESSGAWPRIQQIAGCPNWVFLGNIKTDPGCLARQEGGGQRSISQHTSLAPEMRRKLRLWVLDPQDG